MDTSRIRHYLESRSTTGKYDPAKKITAETISELVRLATYSPSAFNLQNWKFVAVHSEDQKSKLCQAAYGQRQVIDASVTYIICGDLEGYKTLGDALQPSVSEGIITEEIKATWVGMVTESHQDNSELRRDEAIRSASLASMSLMFAADEQGLSTGVVGGFDTEAVQSAFNLPSSILPVMLVTVGYPTAGNWPQKMRKPLHDVLEII